jgi:broad specificity phosphatase PhoE
MKRRSGRQFVCLKYCSWPADLPTQVAAIRCLVTSTMRRAIESAELVAPGRPPLTNALFDEAGLPTAIGLGLALPPEHWGAIARVAWMLGWSPWWPEVDRAARARGAESAREANARAARAATHLANLASTHGSVVLFGHAMLNTLIARALRRDGWTRAGSPRAYWVG